MGGEWIYKNKFEHIFGLYRRPETVRVKYFNNARADYAYLAKYIGWGD